MLDVREQIKKFQMLFDSKGKVINIKAALNDCPEVFKQDSPFTLYAARCIRNTDKSGWQWKTFLSPEEKEQWEKRFSHMIRSADNDIGDRIMFGGWMLSQMIDKVPPPPTKD